eukprot:7911412-Pyramimonas_sp.AAC.1
MIEHLQSTDWVTISRQRKWRWAQKVCSVAEYEWTSQALRWDAQCDSTLGARRRQGHPKKRWSDDI